MLRLRPARLDDPDVLAMIEEVQRWYVELYGGRDVDPIEPDEFAAPRGGFLVGDAEGEPVAMGGWTRSGDAAKVRRMYVRPTGRRRGYASQLLAALEDAARADGAARMLLTTGEPQVAAVALYRALGYSDVEPFGFWVGSPGGVFLGKPL